MDFSLPKEIEDIRKKARDFAVKEFTQELTLTCDATETYPDDIRKKAYNAGFIDVGNPWGMLVSMEEFCRVDPGVGMSALVPGFGSEVIMLYGSDYQKKKYLEPVLKGEKISGFAVTEPIAGSDVAGISTKLYKKDGKWILNGGKMFITNGTIANHFYVLARSAEPDSPEKRHHGLSMAIVESEMKGFSSTKITGKLGMRATSTAELKFDNIEIPQENIIGEEGKGFYYVMSFFNISRIYVAAQALGTAEGALDRLKAYLAALKSRGSPMADYESAQFLLSETATEIEAARMLMYMAADKLFKFEPDPVITSMAKYYSASVAAKATRSVMLFMGLDGIATDMERFYRDSKITEIWEGTSEIEKLVISRMLMKK